MAGIYVHIPFCKQACHYCNFHFSTTLSLQNDFIAALLREIEIQRDYLASQTVTTIYFGGGTPSLLSSEQIAAILQAVNSQFSMAADAELTLEANPDDISAEKVIQWKQSGINRLSIGVQSFFDEDLVWMNRAHGSQQALNSISIAQDAGITNMSIDLIYGGPTLTDERWRSNLETAVKLRVPHLSCYALTVEPGTALQVMTRKKKVQEVSTEHQATQFHIMTDYLNASGYDHYEISNFALPGKRSRHNSSYWSGAHYLGLGPSAHSFNGRSRQWNVANNALYIQSLKKGEVPLEIEKLSRTQQLNEYIMTSLRTMEGTDISRVELQFGKEAAEKLTLDSQPFKDKGWLQRISDRLVLTREGKLFADGIASDLFSE